MTQRSLPLLAAFMLTPIAAGIAQAAPAGRVLMVVGDAAAERSGQKIALKRGTLVEEGDRLTTGAGSSVQVMFTDQGLIALRENTTFRIEKFSFQKGADAANFKLEKGGVRTVTGQVGKANNKDYSLDAVVATIGIRGTNFELVLCEGQCSGDGGAAKNGLYGVVRGASGGTSRITISNDGGEKLLGKNDAFFVADRNSPAQQLVAPPSFVTQRSESTKKSGEKAKGEEGSAENKDSKPSEKAQEKEAAKSEGGAESQKDSAKAEPTKTDSADAQPPSTSQTATGPAGPAGPSPTSTATAGTDTPLVPPPSNQSALLPQPQALTLQGATQPPLQGGSTTTPAGTTISAPTVTATTQAVVFSHVLDPSIGSGHSKGLTVKSQDGTVQAFAYPSPGTTFNRNTLALTEYTAASTGLANFPTDITLGTWLRSAGGAESASDGSFNWHYVRGPAFTGLPASGLIRYQLFAATPPTARDGSDFGRIMKLDGSQEGVGFLNASLGLNLTQNNVAFLKLDPFRIAKVENGVASSADYVLVAGQGSSIGNYTEITLVSGANFSASGALAGGTNGVFFNRPLGTSLSQQLSQSGSANFIAQLFGQSGGALGVSFGITDPEPGDDVPYLTGAMGFAKAESKPSISPRSFIGIASQSGLVRDADSNDAKVLLSNNIPVGVAYPFTPSEDEIVLATPGAPSEYTPVADTEFGMGLWDRAVVHGIPSVLETSELRYVHFVTGPAVVNAPQSGSINYSLKSHTSPTWLTSAGEPLGVGTLSPFGTTGSSTLLRATLHLNFSTPTAGGADGGVGNQLRVDSWKVALNNSEYVISGLDSTLGVFRPVQLTPFAGEGNLAYFGTTTKVFFKESETSPLSAGPLAANVAARLLGTNGDGIGLTYNVGPTPGEFSGPSALGAMLLTKESNQPNPVSVSVLPNSAVLSIGTTVLDSIVSITPVLEPFVNTRSSLASTVTLHDAQHPVAATFPAATQGSNQYVLANFGGVTQVEANKSTDSKYYWGRWNGNDIAEIIPGQTLSALPITNLHFVVGEQLNNLTSGQISYNLVASSNPYSTDGVIRQAPSAYFGPAPITATVFLDLASPSNTEANRLELDSFKLNASNPSQTIYVGDNPFASVPTRMTLTPSGPVTTTDARFSNSGVSAHIGSSTSPSSPPPSAVVSGQLMGNGGEGLGVVYGVTYNNGPGTPTQATTGAMLLRTP